MLLILLQKFEEKSNNHTIELPKIFENLKEENIYAKEKNKSNLNLGKDKNSVSQNNENKSNLNYEFDFLKEKEQINYEDNNINLPKIYNLNEIKNILMKKNFPKEKIDKIKEEFINNKDKESIYLFEIKNKIIGKENKNIILNVIKMKQGRKRLNDNSIREHDKYKPDNIIKKCKGILFSNVIDYINQFINIYKIKDKENFKLYKLDFKKHINNLKKENEMKLFNMKLKDLASFEVSGKYRPKKDENMIEIKKILEQEKNNEIIINLLNMNYGDWIDIFTYKNQFDNDIDFNGLYNSLEKIEEKNNEEYLSRLIFYLFNYKRWFYNKKGRKSKNGFIINYPKNFYNE